MQTNLNATHKPVVVFKFRFAVVFCFVLRFFFCFFFLEFYTFLSGNEEEEEEVEGAIYIFTFLIFVNIQRSQGIANGMKSFVN